MKGLLQCAGGPRQQIKAVAATYIALDRKEEAHNHVVEVLRISPQISLDALRERLPVKDQAELESLLQALREAGLPD
jgi:uncharacterized protein HemY